MKYIVTIFILIFIHLILDKDRIHNNDKFMNIYELLEYNIKLYLINNSGLVDISNRHAKILQFLTNDEIMVKFHRRLNKKYGRYNFER
jgi:hypothetical protein